MSDPHFRLAVGRRQLAQAKFNARPYQNPSVYSYFPSSIGSLFSVFFKESGATFMLVGIVEEDVH